MPDNKEYVRIAHAIYPADDWPENVILYAGEIGWESDTGKFKRGDGYTKWKDLPYYQQRNIDGERIATQNYVIQEKNNTTNYNSKFVEYIESIVNNMGLTPGESGDGNCLDYLPTLGWGGGGQYYGYTYCEINSAWQYILLLEQKGGSYSSFAMYGVLQKDSEGSYWFSSGGVESPSYLENASIEIVNDITINDKVYKTAIKYTYNDYQLLALPLQSWHYCLREDTLIPMEDGTYKTIKDVQPKDKVAFYNTFNHDPEMKYNVVCVPSVTSKPPKYKTFTFSNGSVLHIGGNHMLFNTEADAIVGSDEWKVGMHGIGEDGSEIELIGIEEKENTEGLTFYNIFTRHYRYLANGVLCGHSQAALGKEFAKMTNQKYRFKDQDYMNYLSRKHLEKESLEKDFIPLSIAPEIYRIRKGSKELDQIEKENQVYLNETDYKVTKYISGLISKEEYEASEKLREEAREKIRRARNSKKEIEEHVKQRKLEYLDTISSVKGVW